VEAFVGEPPRGLDFLMGLDVQEILGVTVSPRNHTVHFADRKIMVRTDPIKDVVSRVRAQPLRVLATLWMQLCLCCRTQHGFPSTLMGIN